MKCTSCGQRVNRRDKFCPRCGNLVVPRTATQLPAQPKPQWPIIVALVAVGAIIGAVALNFIKGSSEASHTHTHDGFDPTLRGEALAQAYPDVYQVASQFICPCGTCTDGLEVCDCNMTKGSSEVRAEIFELLQAHKPPHVIEIIAQKYGHRKSSVPEFVPPPATQSNSGQIPNLKRQIPTKSQ